jgi:hypothetical protein
LIKPCVEINVKDFFALRRITFAAKIEAIARLIGFDDLKHQF